VVDIVFSLEFVGRANSIRIVGRTNNCLDWWP
jgi:hypothetical protein